MSGSDPRAPGGAPAGGRHASRERGARRMNREARDLMGRADMAWYTVFVRAGREFRVQRILHGWGACYLPLCRRWRRVNRYRREKARIADPAIAGCLFMGVERGRERWFDLKSIDSVHGVLGRNGCPVALDGARLAAFAARNRPRFGEDAPAIPDVAAGDAVRIAGGPFDVHIVNVTDIRGRTAHILMTLLGHEQDIKIPLDKLEKVS